MGFFNPKKQIKIKPITMIKVNEDQVKPNEEELMLKMALMSQTFNQYKIQNARDCSLQNPSQKYRLPSNRLAPIPGKQVITPKSQPDTHFFLEAMRDIQNKKKQKAN